MNNGKEIYKTKKEKLRTEPDKEKSGYIHDFITVRYYVLRITYYVLLRGRFWFLI